MNFQILEGRAFAVAAALAVVFLTSLLWCFDPASSIVFPSCPFYSLTGLYCPGCGTLRALHRLLHFNVGAALSMNPLTVISLPFVGYGLISAFLFRVWGRGLPRLGVHHFWLWALFGIIVLFGVFRNFPFYPFFYLSPGGLPQ